MNKHCKGCLHHHNAGRRHPTKQEQKFNDWCCKRGGAVDVGWCKTHSAKTLRALKISTPSQGTTP